MKQKFSRQVSYFFKTRPVGAELFHEDRRTDMALLNVTFRSFANAPKNVVVESVVVFAYLSLTCFFLT